MAPRRARGIPAACATLLLVAGCATTDDVSRLESRLEEVEKANQVQNQRLTDIERGTGRELERLEQQLDERVEAARSRLAQRLEETAGSLGASIQGTRETLGGRLKSVEGGVQVLTERSDRLVVEQQRQIETMEKNQAQVRALERRHEKHLKATEDWRGEQDELISQLHQTQTELQTQHDKQLASLDATRTRLAAVEELLQSPIGDLPSKTQADRLYREAFYQVVQAQLDLAADRFAEFRETYPDDERAVEALYRQGQAYFLQRKFDHALVPLFDLVDQHPEHPRAADAKWYLARSLEETGDFALARRFYGEMIEGGSKYKPDAIRRVKFINALQPASDGDGQQAADS